MKCVICGQRNVDGAIDQNGDYVCVDCWVEGAAMEEGRKEVVSIEADTPFSGR